MPRRAGGTEVGSLATERFLERANSLLVVPGLCSDTRESTAHASGLQAESARPFEYSLAANERCAPPGGFYADCQCIAAPAAFVRPFESRKLQFHNTHAFAINSAIQSGINTGITLFPCRR